MDDSVNPVLSNCPAVTSKRPQAQSPPKYLRDSDFISERIPWDDLENRLRSWSIRPFLTTGTHYNCVDAAKSAPLTNYYRLVESPSRSVHSVIAIKEHSTELWSPQPWVYSRCVMSSSLVSLETRHLERPIHLKPVKAQSPSFTHKITKSIAKSPRVAELVVPR
ncbi:hypothetical protein TNCV_2584941 [Trichonephila clavipes]|nr:hypothetical protein TNCV_2584941 [Trichonephila clavipes]